MKTEPNPYSLLVGRIAYRVFRANSAGVINEQNVGGTHAVVGFEVEEVLGFALALSEDSSIAHRCEIQLPLQKFQEYEVPESYLTNKGAVDGRNEDSDKIVIVPVLDGVNEESFRHCDRTDTGSVESLDAIELYWIPAIFEFLEESGLPESSERNLKALAKGLVRSTTVNLSKAVEFLVSTAQKVASEGSVGMAAGQSMPILELPLYKDCFASIRADRLNNFKSWSDAIKKHALTKCYIKKQDSKNQPLEGEMLRGRLKNLEGGTGTQVSAELVAAFKAYIDAPHGQSAATTDLLYNFDWSLTRGCFEKSKSSLSTSFVSRTRDVLLGSGHELSPEEEETLQAISRSKSKSGTIKDDAKDFFEAHSEAINEDPKLYSEWQKLIHGSKITGSNLMAMIIESFRLADLNHDGASYKVVLEGIRQGGIKPQYAPIRKYNPAACDYFVHSCGGLPKLTGNLVTFRHSLAAEYHFEKVQKYLSNNKPKKSSGKSANTLEFNLIIEKLEGGVSTQVEKRPIAWVFNPDSIISEQTGDFSRLAKLIAESPKTALIRNCGQYERVGPKGTAPTLCLRDLSGFTDEYGAGGKGSFVPAKSRAKDHSLIRAWTECIDKAKAENVDPERIQAIEDIAVKFKKSYEGLVTSLSKDILCQQGVAEMSEAYRDLLIQLSEFRPEKFRNELIRIILSIGNAEVPRSGRRPAVSVICPWHPLRIEAFAARAMQFKTILDQLCSKNRPTYSDERGELFFKECASVFEQPLYPEISTIREQSQIRLRAASEAVEGYSLHIPVESEENGSELLADTSKRSATIISHQVQEYLRLQPHERDNLSIGLYDCKSASLPSEIVSEIEKHNRENPDKEITCQIYLMHRDKALLREMYQQLVTTEMGAHGDGPAEATGDLLSRIRVNVAASNAIEMSARGEPVDIIYCKDVITGIVNKKDGFSWRRQPRVTHDPISLFPHRWSRRLPIEHGAKRTWSLLSCPAMTQSGWAHLNAITSFFSADHQDAWDRNECMMPVTVLNFEDADIEKVFAETHKLGTWVINEDELLERKLLEDNDVKVIRYIQSSTQGRNLIISSTSRETLLRNTLRGRLQQLLPGTPEPERLATLAKKFIEDANHISGGLFLRSARRANNTGELMGMVLSRFIVQQETQAKPTAWCFLDDYAQWLGKREDTHMADLLVLSWDASDEVPVLDVIVTEAKFVNAAVAPDKTKESAIQLRHTLAQLEEALLATNAPVDQDIWLARLSNLFLSRVTFTGGPGDSDPSAWANMIRNRQCKVRIRGYSHVFVHSPDDAYLPDSKKIPKTVNGIQEVFPPASVRSLVQLYEAAETPDPAQTGVTLKQIRNVHLLEIIQKTPQIISVPVGHSALQKKTPRVKVAPSADTEAPAQDSEGAQTPQASEEAESEASTPQPAPPETAEAAAANDQAAPDEGNPPLEQPASQPDNDTSHPSQAPPLPTPAIEAPILPSGGLLEFLGNRASALASSKDEGLEWLKAVEGKLRSAFINRQMPFQPVEGFEPILTPNAGIFRVKGRDNLTVSIIEAKSTEIYTTEGILILAVNPEPGRLRITVARPERELLHTEAVLYDFMLNHAADAAKERLLVGIKEEDGKPLLLDPFAQPHSLVAGSTGSGKSVLMQNIILCIAASRTPEESLIFLIDPKYGVDYMALQGLPHIQNGSGGIIDTQEEAMECLEAAVEEMERRLKLMKAASVEYGVGIANVLAYRKVTGKSLPTWWLIHDEFADWMQTDEYKKAIPHVVNRLGIKARAAGIFLIFGAQRPDKDVFPMQLRAQLMNRLVLKVDGTGTSAIALEGKAGAAERLLGKGHMLAKLLDPPEPVFTQVPFIDPSTDLPTLVQAIIAHHQKSAKLTQVKAVLDAV